MDGIQDILNTNSKLERRLATLEKALEKLSLNQEKTMDKNISLSSNKNNPKKIEGDIISATDSIKSKLDIRGIKSSVNEEFTKTLPSYKENRENEIKIPKENENTYKEIRESYNLRKEKRASKKSLLNEIEEMDFIDKDFKENNKNDYKYSQIFNKVKTERPYLIETSSNNILKESKKNLKSNLQPEEEINNIFIGFPQEKLPKQDHQKTHSFYLNSEDQNPRRKTHSSIDNIEKQEKRKKIDEGFKQYFNIKFDN